MQERIGHSLLEDVVKDILKTRYKRVEQQERGADFLVQQEETNRIKAIEVKPMFLTENQIADLRFMGGEVWLVSQTKIVRLKFIKEEMI